MSRIPDTPSPPPWSLHQLPQWPSRAHTHGCMAILHDQPKMKKVNFVWQMGPPYMWVQAKNERYLFYSLLSSLLSSLKRQWQGRVLPVDRALKDNGKGESSQWIELWVVYFVRERCSLRLEYIWKLMGSGRWPGQLTRVLEGKRRLEGCRQGGLA